MPASSDRKKCLCFWAGKNRRRTYRSDIESMVSDRDGLFSLYSKIIKRNLKRYPRIEVGEHKVNKVEIASISWTCDDC